MGRSDIASEKGVWKAFLKTLKITLDVETWEDFTGADKKKKRKAQWAKSRVEGKVCEKVQDDLRKRTHRPVRCPGCVGGVSSSPE